MKLAPIALFVYNRPWHTQQTVEALKRNTLAIESDLIVFSDGAKNGRDKENVEEVREYIQSIRGFKSVVLHKSQSNKGLANSIISGVTRVLETSPSVIVLEDDLVTSVHFLSFLNQALELYENEPRVVSIHGYMYPVKVKLPDTLFIRGADCWGWATWRRGWQLFNKDGAHLLNQLESGDLTDEFDFFGTYPYTQMLRKQIRGANDSWAIRWYASAFLAGKFTLYPGRSLVHNIGNDRSGTHSAATANFDTQVSERPIAVERISLEENTNSKRAMAEYFKKGTPSFFSKLMNRVKSLLPAC